MSAEPADQIRVTLVKLRRARAEANALFSKIADENNRAATQAKQVSQNVDTAAYLLNMFVSLTKLVTSAQKGLKLTGEALERHNKAVLNEFAQNKSIHDGTLIATTLLADVSEGRALLMGKAALKAINDIQSPSFWAGMYADVYTDGGRKWDPAKWSNYVEHGRERADRCIAATRSQALVNIDRKIRKYEAILAQLSQVGNRPAGSAPR